MEYLNYVDIIVILHNLYYWNEKLELFVMKDFVLSHEIVKKAPRLNHIYSRFEVFFFFAMTRICTERNFTLKLRERQETSCSE